jgi:hypothetical protein
MANFPGSLDTLTNPIAGDTLDSPSHSGQHATANDILEAVEAKVGTGASTPTAGTVLTGTGVGTSGWQAPSVDVLQDPGNVYEEGLAVEVGYRIAETVDGDLRVYVVTTAGTTDIGFVFADYVPSVAPLGTTTTNDVVWTHLGIVGALPWDIMPTDGLPAQWTVDGNGGLVLAYEDTQGSVPAIKVTYVGDPTDYIQLLQLGTDDAPVFTIDSTADADVRFRDSGVSWIWHDAPGGHGHVVKIGTDGVSLGPPSGFLQVDYGDQLYVLGPTGVVFQIMFATGAVLLPNLPTSDPGVAGQLFSNGVPSAGTPKALMVSGG